MTLYRGGRVVELTRDEINRRLIATWAALQGAQAAYRHSPNSTTERQLASVRAAMDRHLDALIGMLPAPREASE